MTRRTPSPRPCTLLLLGMAPFWWGCDRPAPGPVFLGPPGSSETHVLVEVRRGPVRDDVWRIRSVVTVQETTSETLLPEDPPRRPLDFPSNYVVVARGREGRVEVRADAMDQDGRTVAKARGSVDLVTSEGVQLVLVLAQACHDGEDCQDGIFCNGEEVCLDGVCGPGQQACSPSPFSCVAVTCDEEERACAVRADHAPCRQAADGGGSAWYCDPRRGCVEGMPGAPTLVGTPVLSPTAGTVGTLFALALEVSEPLLTDPVVEVEVGGRLAAFVVEPARTDRPARRYGLTYLATGSEVEGQRPVRVELVDRSGTRSVGLSAGTMVLDFTPPVARAATLDRAALRSGATATLALAFSEPVEHAPVVVMESAGGGGVGLGWEATLLDPPAHTWTFRYTATGAEEPGSYLLAVSARDPAGNALVPDAWPSLTLDFKPPQVTSVEVDPRMARPGAVISVTVELLEPVTRTPWVEAQDGQGRSLLFTTESARPTTLAYSHAVQRGEDGTYVLHLRDLEDAAGNVGPAQALGVVRVDGTPPAVLRYAQTATALRSGDVLGVEIEFNEPLLSPPVLLLDGTPLELTEPLDTRGGLYVLRLAGRDMDGLHQVEARAEDQAGNATTVRPGPVTRVDTLPPRLLDLAFSPPVARLNTTALLSLTTDEPLLDAPLLRWEAGLGDPGFFPLASTGLVHSYAMAVTDGATPGSFRLASVVLTDVVGNTVEVPVTGGAGSFTVDNTAPRLSNLVADRTRYSARPGYNRVTLTLDASEELGDAGSALEVSLLGHPAACVPHPTHPARHTCVLDVTDTMPEGAHTMDVVARDAAGNYGHATVTVVLDFSPPVLSYARPVPSHARMGDTILYTITPSEPLLGLPDLTLRGPGPLSFAYWEGSAHVFEHQVSPGDADGTYTVTVTLEDTVGNRAQDLPAPPVHVDVTVPRVLGLQVTRPVFRHGQEVVATLDISEPMEGDGAVLSVRLGDVAMACGADQVTSPQFRCATTVDDRFPEGPSLVTVTARDAAGNTGFGSTPVTLDFSPPALVSGSVSLSLEPPAGCLLRSVGAVTTGTVVRLTLSVTEPLGGPPVLAAPGAGTPDFTVEPSSGFTHAFRLAYAGDADSPQGAFDLVLLLEDQVGNRTALSLPPPHRLVVDTLPPAPLTEEQRGRLVYRRAPWGHEESDGLPSFQVASTGDHTAEPGSTLVFWDRADVVSGLEVGRAVVDAVGGLVPTRLNALDRARLFVTQVDGACNTDGPVATLLTEVEWVATMGRKNPGSLVGNPHRFESRAWHVDGARAVTPASLGVREEGEASLGRVGGQAVSIRGATYGYVLAPPGHPPSLSRHALVHDSLRQRVVLFGGCTGTPSYECTTPVDATWELTGHGWNRVTTSDRDNDGDPFQRGSMAMVFDARRGRTVLFGGMLLSGTGPNTGSNGDTWEYDGSGWRKAAPTDPEGDGNPEPRASHAMAYDEHRGVTVLFSGCSSAPSSCSSMREGTWEWNGTSWAKVHPGEGGPATRYQHALAYDRDRRVTVLSGGWGSSGVLSDVWEWNGEAWRLAASGGGPQRHRSHSLVFDPARGRVVLFGGTDGSGLIQNHLWSWNGASWERINPTAGPDGLPSARVEQGLAYDTVRGELVLHGGYNVSARLDDTWTFRDNTWRRKVPTPPALGPPPPGAWLGTLTHVPSRSTSVRFGGAAEVSPLDATWSWDGRAWSQVPVTPGPDGLPAARYAHLALLDATTQGILLLGGDDYMGACSGWACRRLWSFGGTSWTALTPAGTGPLHAYFQDGAYDTVRQQLVVMPACVSGLGCDPATWTWSSTQQAWTERKASSFPGGIHPSPRFWGATGFDPRRGVVVNWGGDTQDPEPTPRPVWEFNGTSWTPVTPVDGVEPPTTYCQFYDDTELGRLVLVTHDEVGPNVGRPGHWTWDGERWTGLVIAGLPSALVMPALGPGITYDTTRREVVAYSGQYAGGEYSEDTWLGTSGKLSRPAGVFRVDLSGLNLGPTALEWVEVRAVAGGHGEGPSGVELLLWHGGAWHTVDSHQGAPDAAAPLLARLTDAAVLPLVESGRAVYAAVTTAARNGQGVAELGVDYVELRVRYRLP